MSNYIDKIRYNGMDYTIGGSNLDVYSEEEQVIGIWKDGKPLYRKTVTFVPNTYEYATRHDIANIERIVNRYGTAGNEGSFQLPYVSIIAGWSAEIHTNLDFIFLKAEGSFPLNEEFNVTLEYTKTTDVPGDMPYNPTTMVTTANLEVYSEEERVVGIWVDGKPLYRRTIVLENGTQQVWGKAFYYKDYGIYDIDHVHPAHPSYFSQLDESVTQSFDFYDGNTYKVETYKDHILVTSTYEPISIGKMVVSFEYTKTTDQPGDYKPLQDETVFKNYCKETIGQFGLGSQCKNINEQDLNTCCGLETGFYMGSNMANAPSSDWYYILHLVHNDLYQRQIAYELNGIGTRSRIKQAGIWSPWL